MATPMKYTQLTSIFRANDYTQPKDKPRTWVGSKGKTRVEITIHQELDLAAIHLDGVARPGLPDFKAVADFVRGKVA